MPDATARARWRWLESDPPQVALAARADWSLDREWPWPPLLAQPLGRNAGRSVWRIAGEPAAIAKAFERSAARTAEREAAALAACARHAIAAPRLLGSARRDDGARLLLLEAACGVPLEVRLAGASPRERRSLLAALAAAIAAMHAAGIAHRQLHAWHAWVVAAADRAAPPRIVFLDWAQARCGRRVSRTARARDLAALLATLDRKTLSLAERARLLARVEPPRIGRRALVAAIRTAQVAAHGKGRLPWPHGMRDRGGAGGRVVVAEGAAAAIEQRDGGDALAVERWLEPATAIVVRRRDGRANLRWPDPPGEPGATWFGKRFTRASRWHARAPAFQEWVNGRALAALGIAVPEVVAVARRAGGASVLWTRGVTPGTTLRELLPRLPPGAPARRARLHEAARIARRLHAAGFVHRDLYLDHFLVGADGAPLVLIDHSRIERHRVLPERKRSKDLAALEFSARAAGATRCERMRALLFYVAGDRRRARALARRVLRKAARIAAHEQRHGRPSPSA